MYEDMTDELMVELAQGGDDDAEERLIRKYKDMVRGKARIYFMAGADSEDIVQEGMIGVFKAIRGYKGEKDASFRTFAETCVNNQILSAVKAAKSRKHEPLNDSLSLSGPLADTLHSSSRTDPEALYILKEGMSKLESGSVLSDMELRIWGEYMKGRTYREIAGITGKTPKAVDNAIQRIRRKFLTRAK